MASRTRELQGLPCRGRLRWPGVWRSCSYSPCWRRVPCRRRRCAPSQPSSRSSQPSRFRSWLPPWSPSAIPYLTLSGHRRRRRRALGRRPRAFCAPRCQKTFLHLVLLFRFTQRARYYIMRPNFHPLKTRTLHSAKMDPDRSRFLLFFFFFWISILMSCLAARSDRAGETFFEMAVETR